MPVFLLVQASKNNFHRVTYSKKYVSFINGRYANEGVRITIGILLPSLLMNYFGQLHAGIIMSIGALCVSVADAPGVVKHRVNGMLACIILVTVISDLVYFSSANIFIQGLVICFGGFFFSMLTVYGARSASVGIAAMLIMVLSLQTPLKGHDILLHTVYTLCGGIWYMLYSLLLHRLRPYKFIQQVLSDYISEVAGYLRLRGNLYDTNPDYEDVDAQLLQKQISIDAQQTMLSELIFNTRAIVKESTHTGRIVMKHYMEVVELYESVMTTYQQYRLLHEQFDTTGILTAYRDIIYLLADEMDEIGHAIKTGNKSMPSHLVDKKIEATRNQFELLRKDFMKKDTVEHFVSLGRILNNLQDIAERIARLHLYSTQKPAEIRKSEHAKAYAYFSPTEDIRPILFWNNLNMSSNIFRHALRVSLALLAGFVISYFFKVDRGYWVLLTIVVILKPAYSLSKRRNSDRLIGTALGVVAGMLVLLIIKNDSVLLGLMILFMLGSFIYFRTNYFLSVFLMTPYLLIFFHFLYPGILRDLMVDRIVDTAIGSAIAFFASLFLVPVWERENIKAYMLAMLEASEKYYTVIATQFSQQVPVNVIEIKLARKDELVALANLSNAFTRMLSEPKRFRQGIKNIHQFVVMNHTLIAHFATLSHLLQKDIISFRSENLLPMIQKTKVHFNNARIVLQDSKLPTQSDEAFNTQGIQNRLAALVEKRKAEIEAGLLETPVKNELVEIKSIVDQFNYILNDARAIYKIAAEHDREMQIKI